MIRQFELVDRLKRYDPSMDEDMVNRAYVFSLKAHGTQVRANGDPYFSHPLEVAGILTELKLDSCSIVTALLHDTVEDTVATLDEIQKLFGTEIAKLVDGVTKLSRLELQSEATQQAENFRKLVLAMSSDIRVLLVKLADRLHNMRTIQYINDPIKRRRIARETMDIYVPLAERMGMQRIKDELEDLAFSVLNPEMYESIKSRLSFLYQSSENAIESIIDHLKQCANNLGLPCSVNGRLKTPYSVWRKMQQKNVAFEQLADIMAFRLTVNTIPECYQALGIIHSHYLVVPGRFKDYISTPKANNYQSLHTGLIGPLNQRIEMQIRTTEMNQVCELGVAAHWQYKKEGDGDLHDGKQYAWLRGLLEILEQASNPEEFLEHTKLEMFQDQVFCFTPKGELFSLPKGATTIDFAYAIHSAIGDRTIGAKINGRQAPLRTILENGDQVEIITANNHSPSPTWERFVVTGKARARIRRFVRTQQRQQFSDLGKSLLHKACIREHVQFSEKTFSAVLKSFQYPLLEDLYAAIGEGIQTAKEVIATAYVSEKKVDPSKQGALDAENKIMLHKKANSVDHSPVCINGLIPGMAVHYAGCCHPLPGDMIVGVVISGKGVTIHTHDCEVLSTIDPDRLLDLSWHERVDENMRLVGRLKVTFHNKPGSLAATTTAISKQNSNIINLKITNRTEDFWELLVDIEVKDVDHLNNIKGTLRSLSITNHVERI
ncbi:MAG: bifunctional (p)ppGpp synthetase/guanosine-3',5'-bis(diphosphate) 3'-pyrophosphohydrolase [Alphaproteobacteria bacterium]|nr:bifunctional (p)ppGpp synthetase/guanosine-3',5'-bis(diphosphate) 3'-pyrophosphohydrolase [Alphaproteobacteria bacterium]